MYIQYTYYYIYIDFDGGFVVIYLLFAPFFVAGLNPRDQEKNMVKLGSSGRKPPKKTVPYRRYHWKT